MSLGQHSASVWGLAALAAAVESGLYDALGEPRDAAALAAEARIPALLAERLLDVLVGAGFAVRDGGRFARADGLPGTELLRADLRTTLLQSQALVASARAGDLSLGWGHTDEDVLQSQGTLSSGAVAFLENVLFPSVPGILERLRAPGAAFLDVGTGVGAVTIGLLRRFPSVRAVGIEPLDAPLALARANVAAAGLEDRVELRRQLVQDLPDERAFDVAWLPGNFMSREVLGEALAVVHRALRPGGLVLLATLGGGGEDLGSAAARLRATLWGGDSIEPEAVVALLERAGYVDIIVLDRLPGGLLPMHARRASEPGS
jgi:SAM-dependent methyltransferase